jgi:hypothetical protein
MAEDMDALFDDYVRRFARGERPDLRDYLTRAGERADELGGLVDAFLLRVPPPEPDEAGRALAEAWVKGDAPLVELRARRGLRRDDVVDTLVEQLDLDRAKRAKVKRYYHELESGLLEPRRVDARVWEVLAEALRARVSDLVSWRPRPLQFDAVYSRVDPAVSAALRSPAAMAERAEPPEPDEIDRLFGK